MVLQVDARINDDLYGSWNVFNYHFWFPLLWKRTSMVSQCRKCEKKKQVDTSEKSRCVTPRDRKNSLDLRREMIYFKMYSVYRFVYRRGQVVVHHFIASFFAEKRTVWRKRDFLLQSDCHMSEDDVPRKIENWIIMVLLYLYCHRRTIDEYFHC